MWARLPKPSPSLSPASPITWGVYYSLNEENIRECCGMLMTKFVPETSCDSADESLELIDG